MTVPLSTTTITVRKPDTGGDSYETAALATVAAGVAAHISTPTGNETQAGGSQERVDAVLLCDPIVDLDHYCQITDDATDETYQVTWVRTRHGLGLDHVRAGLLVVAGGSNG